MSAYACACLSLYCHCHMRAVVELSLGRLDPAPPRVFHFQSTYSMLLLQNHLTFKFTYTRPDMFASRAAHATCNARARFLSLPSHLRRLSHQQPNHNRSFSASPSNKVQLTDVFAAPPLYILQGLHVVGLPWYAAIPVASILIRGIVGYYLAAVPARRRQLIRNNLNPLIAAAVRNDMSHSPTGEGTPLEKWIPSPDLRKKVYPTWLLWKNSQVYGKRFGAPQLALSSFFNFLSLISTSEAVRMLCGAREGLLSTLLSPFTWLGREFAPDYFPPGVSAVDVVANAYADKVEQLRQARLQGLPEDDADKGIDLDALSGNVLQNPQPLPPQLINTDMSHFDPSLQTEGLSWCVDLTAADPYSALPILTCAMMAGNVLLNPRPIPASTSLPNGPAWRPVRFFMQRYSFGQKFMLAIVCALGYSLREVPAAVILYFLSSIVTGFVQRRLVNLNMPLRSPIRPCLRRTRVKSKKQFNIRL
jgi:inner membrane protein COX18